MFPEGSKEQMHNMHLPIQALSLPILSGPEVIKKFNAQLSWHSNIYEQEK